MNRPSAIVAVLTLALGGCGKPARVAAPAAPAPQGPGHAPLEATPAEEEFEVISGVGTLSSEQVLQTVEPHVKAITACVYAQAYEAPWLGGDIELQWEVAPTGEVATAILRKSTLGSWPAEACIVALASQLTFPKPKGGPATVALPMEIPPVKRPLTLDPLRVRGALIPGLIKLQKTCGAQADINATAYVGERGRVLSVGFARAQPIDVTWADCATAEITAWVVSANRGYISKVEFTAAP